MMQPPHVQILEGDALAVLRTLPDESVNTCVTSPPYFGLRDYHVRGQIGLERTPEEFIARLVQVFGEVRRVLRNDGTLWVVIGDSYATGGGKAKQPGGGYRGEHGDSKKQKWAGPYCQPNRMPLPGLKPSDLIGIPWMLAFALRADGWWLRSDIIYHKTNPMPESVKSRPTKSHEYIFLLAKSRSYYYDHEAIKEPTKADTQARYERGRGANPKYADGGPGNQTIARTLAHMRSGNKVRRIADGKDRCRLNSHLGSGVPWEDDGKGRNKRTVWTCSTKNFKGAHFATYPTALITPCILAGCPAGGIVLDPFCGSGTTGLVAKQHGRNFIGIELSSDYAKMARERIEPALLARAA